MAAIGCLTGFFFAIKGNQRNDINEAIQRTEQTTKISTKLDGIASDVRSTGKRVEQMQENLASHSEKIAKIEDQVKSAHNRIDEIVERINKKE